MNELTSTTNAFDEILGQSVANTEKQNHVYIVTLGVGETNKFYAGFKTYTLKTSCQPEQLLQEIEMKLFPNVLDDCFDGNKKTFEDVKDEIYIHFMMKVS